MLRSVPQLLKKWRIVVDRISKVRQTTCIWIKKILDEATRIVNVFLISRFFYLFLLCSISLLVKYDFILRYEAWVNAIRASTFIENFAQISAKPIAFQRNLLGKLSRNRPFFTNRFSAKLASKIPTKFPRNRPFFPWIYPWKSREIWLFFRDLPEALLNECSLLSRWMKVLNFNLFSLRLKNIQLIKFSLEMTNFALHVCWVIWRHSAWLDIVFQCHQTPSRDTCNMSILQASRS